MNIFRLFGDLSHLASIIILLHKIRISKSCAGISLKTQELYLLIFLLRYLDLFWNFISVYNSIMKIFFIISTCSVIYLIRFRYRNTYDRDNDGFPVVYILAPCFVISLFFNQGFEFYEILWAFSIYLEAVVILPQLVMIQRRKGEVDILTGDYIATLGGYRALYLINWIYRFITEPGYVQWIVWISGSIQTALYLDFFYYYFKSKRTNSVLVLPH
eukprot:TRINITY_DN1372_c2_g2_i1.p1 TRINITY_DN1372_c2_g2~~TRINITY_DN1372_c2_g2_i1.p1  ORF type:complete len:215 (+),score=29.40 TRINITY_DN1372_c2_g2_i1:62-706(+)